MSCCFHLLSQSLVHQASELPDWLFKVIVFINFLNLYDEFLCEVMPWCRFCCGFAGARFFTCRTHCHFTAKGNQKGASSDISLIQQVVRFHTSTEHTALSDKTLTRVFKSLELCHNRRNSIVTQIACNYRKSIRCTVFLEQCFSL